MKALDTMIQKLRSLDSEVKKAIEAVVKDNESIIVEMNSEDQLYEKGITREGAKIAKFAPYSPLTVQYKRAKGQPTGRVTLRDEGDFHLSFYIEFKSDGFEIKSSDWKADMLLKGYGESILGLSDANFNDLKDNYIAPAIAEIFKKI